MYLNIIKAMYDKSIDNILKSEKPYNFSSKIKTRMLTLDNFIQYSTESANQSN